MDESVAQISGYTNSQCGVGVRVFSVRASSVSWLVFTSLYRRLPHRKWLFNQSSMSC